MTPFERRLSKLEEDRRPEPADSLQVVFLHSPEDMTDLAEQDRWATGQMAGQPVGGKQTLCVHFVRHRTAVGWPAR